MSAIFNSNKAAGSSMRRQRTRNASAQFRARQEGMSDEGKHCGKCGDYYPSISTNGDGGFATTAAATSFVARTKW